MSAGAVAVADLLRERGVISADAPAPELHDSDRPWFIALLQGIAGWLAGAFLLTFVAMLLKPETTNGIVFCGLFLLGGAWTLYWFARDIVFLEQLALALSIAGQFALAWAIMKDHNSMTLVAGLLLAMQCAVFAGLPNKQARTLSACFAAIAWIYLVRFSLLPASDSHRMFLDEGGMFNPPRFGTATAVVSWLITWTPLVAAVSWLLRTEVRWMASGARAFARPALAGLLISLSLASIITEPFSSLILGLDEHGAALGWYAIFPLLSIGLALFAAWGAFRVRSPGLLGLAIVASLAHLSRFYYLFGATLLVKSVIMLAIGAALLGIAILLRTEDA